MGGRSAAGSIILGSIDSCLPSAPHAIKEQISMNSQKLDKERSSFYEELRIAGMTPLWEQLHNLVPHTPTTSVVPAHWDYENNIKGHLRRAGELISAQDAERRVLVLENPGLPGAASATGTLYAGIQLLLPGEVARAHRHSQSALRFILEGNGAYTTIEGERTIMHPGDFLITPGWCFHDHGNETADPCIWLDGLDLPLVGFLGAGFAQSMRQTLQTVARPTSSRNACFGNNMLPVNWTKDRLSPILSYPYSKSVETLRALERDASPDEFHGYKMRFINPSTGGYPLPTIGAFIQLIPKGLTTAKYRSTDSTLYCVVEGTGETLISDVKFIWKPRDLFVIPSWHEHTHYVHEDAILFSFSDRPVQESLGLWRELRGHPYTGYESG
jgi:gentisate 1,2-dioxygenase